MKIALIGYGKMGQMIASVARERGHEVVCIIDPLTSTDTIDSPAFRSADVAIEFSRPDAAEANVRAAIAQGVPVVSGTTGWDVQALQAEMQGKEHAGIIWSSNYSIGVNILFAVNTYLARLLRNSGGYSPCITEVHHVHKLDAPSGTAKTLKEQIVEYGLDGTNGKDIPVESIRKGEVPGIHEVRWESEADILTLRHEAKSRKGFALGAVLAAEWLKGKRGWHQLGEVLDI
ncbi:MAG: 4-hydroxy-tetrahydrodipicolinate reductase [Paludibacteraceae bacterium]|nr:4-hydroxy-tetrahydrodipicolinate reductase [Paludibacteraceae bacterium]